MTNLESVELLVFFLTFVLWSFTDWLIEYRRPMKCLKTLDFHCDNCKCWTCPRYYIEKCKRKSDEK